MFMSKPLINHVYIFLRLRHFWALLIVKNDRHCLTKQYLLPITPNSFFHCSLLQFLWAETHTISATTDRPH